LAEREVMRIRKQNISTRMRIAVILFGLCLLCFSYIDHLEKSCSDSIEGCLLLQRVDFSVPGDYTATINLGKYLLKRHRLELRVPKPKLPRGSNRDDQDMLAGLQGTYSISDGNNVSSGSIEQNGRPSDESYYHTMISIGHCPLEEGTHQVNIVITEGASALAGIPQQLVLRDGAYGVKYVPHMLACSIVGGCSALVSGLIMMHSIIGQIRKKWLRGSQHQSAVDAAAHRD